MNDEITTIYLSPLEAKQWAMMQFLTSIGVFDIRGGRVTLDFDYLGRIGNVKIEQNYKPPITS